ncbi:DMT family transporter [Coralliovum pocilloporae]|uniref:DMT family transporter n=1 Tax=Coralliovum pocilloporae TaxID=3066369 RepID=UPI003306CE56
MFTSIRGLVPSPGILSKGKTGNPFAILAMVLAMISFTLNDTLIKFIGESLPLGQIIFIRGVMAMTLLGAIIFATGAHHSYRAMAQRPNLFRGVFEAIATVTFLIALFQMQLGVATAILQAMPLVVTAGSALLFKEQVGWRRWSAILIGFAGVLLIIRPGFDGFTVFSLFVVGTVFAASARDLSTRLLTPDLPTLLISFTTLAFVTPTGLLLGLNEDWSIPELWQWGILLSAAVMLVAAQLLIVMATRFGDFSVVSPFRYTSVLAAIILGFLVWGDIPDLPMIIGVLIIVSTGLYSLHREQVRAREAKLNQSD